MATTKTKSAPAKANVPARTGAAKSLAPIGDDNKPAYLLALEEQNKGKTINADNFDQSDVALPRIKLLQATSKECEAFEDAKPGLFWHTGLDIPLSSAEKPELDFVVCARNKKYLLVAPLEDGQGILARADHFTEWDRTGTWQVKMRGVKKPIEWSIADKNVVASGLDQWGTSNPEDEDSPPAATLFYDYLVLIPDRPDLGPAIYTLARSGIQRAKRGLNDKIKMHETNGRPMQAIVFRAKPTNETGAEGAYKNVQFSTNGFASEDVFNSAYELRGALADYKVQDEEGAAREEPTKDGKAAESKDF